MSKPAVYVFPHNYYPCRSPYGLKSAVSRDVLECALATIQVALDESLVAEDWAQLLMAAPALAELGYGEVVLLSPGESAIDIDLHWNWENHAIQIARSTPEKVTEVYNALHFVEASNLADLYLLERYMPLVVAAYTPKAEFSEFVWEAISRLPVSDGQAMWPLGSDGCPWHLERQGQGVALCCTVPHETCPDDFNPWVSLGGNDLLANIAKQWPQLTPEPISHEFPYFQGRYFCIGPDWSTGMVDGPRS